MFQSASSGESAVVDAITTDLGAGWRGLSNDEWKYLLGWDNNANPKEQASKREAEHRFAKITVSGDTDLASLSTGRYLLIFPDSFTEESDWIETMGPKPTAYDGNGESAGAYTEANFTAMQNAGIVILPGAGCRRDSSWLSVGSDGSYWSSTSDSASIAFRPSFGSSHVDMDNLSKSNYYFCVRLVQNL